MATFAANAITQLMPHTAPRCGHDLGMTGEALRGGVCGADAHTRSDLLAACIEQHAIGVGVWIKLRPGHVFVLQHFVGTQRPRRAVAQRGSTTRHPFEARG